MKKLIAVLIAAAFAGTTLGAFAQTPATPAAPAKTEAKKTDAKKSVKAENGKKKSKAKSKKAEPKS